MTRLEGSLASHKPKSFNQVETRHIGNFLKNMAQTLGDVMDQSVYEYGKAIQVWPQGLEQARK